MNGVINIYKPKGISSFEVVRTIKRLTKVKRVGHTGTLDPEACGVLPICVGKGTKIVEYIMEDYKLYRTKLKLGVITDTLDIEGKILKEKKVEVDEPTIREVINSFIGDVYQVPPMYSAIKINGHRLYELARKGIEIKREKRKITIYDISNINISMPYVSFDVKCSKGTYIRTLCHDIGEKLSCGATMWELERVATGDFTKASSIDLNSINKDNISEYLMPLEKALEKFSKIDFSSKFETLLLNGVTIKNEYILKNIENDKIYRVYINNNAFIGLGRKNEEGFKIIKLLV